MPEPGWHRRSDPFAELVRTVAADPHNPYNIEGYLWVLEEPPARACDECGALFNPAFGHGGDAARGRPRRYCSQRCADRAGYRRHRERTAASRVGERWGRAA